MKKNGALKNATVVWDSTRCLVVYSSILATTSKVVVNPFHQPMRGFVATNLSSSPWRGSVLNALLKSRNTALKALHPLSRCAIITCVKHETASRVLRLALYANWYGSLCRDVKEPISFNTSDSRTLSGTGLHAMGRNFGEVAVDDFFGSGVILVVRQESGSTPVLMDS